jgi:hypothetical protein
MNEWSSTFALRVVVDVASKVIDGDFLPTCLAGPVHVGEALVKNTSNLTVTLAKVSGMGNSRVEHRKAGGRPDAHLLSNEAPRKRYLSRRCF